MLDLVLKVLFLLRFAAFIGIVYLLLHMLVARLAKPDGKFLGFFALITSPLTRPIRSALPPGTPERKVRVAALGALATLWLAAMLLGAGIRAMAR